MKKPAPRRAVIESPPETCGSCRFADDVLGEDDLICIGTPPVPLLEQDGTVTWHRGGPVKAAESACAFYGHKGRA